MNKKCINNVRIIKAYSLFLTEAKRLSEHSVDAVLKSINRFEEYNQFKDFKQFHYQQAVGFKKYLLKQKNVTTGEMLSKKTISTSLQQLKSFFQWLVMQNEYKNKIQYTDTEYFNLSKKDARIAASKRKKLVPKIDQIISVLEIMPCINSVELRDRALVAFTLLTGARDGAIASIKLKHIDLNDNSLFQDASEVKTKFSKTFTTYFFPVGDLPLQIFSEWVHYLTNELEFGPEAPLFPKTKVENAPSRQFEAMGLTKEHWTTAGPIRRVFKRAFRMADLPYFNPHSFRNTLVQLGEELCHSAEEFKAWSQNLGHEGVLTTFYSYGHVPDYKQAALVRKLGKKAENVDPDVEEQFKQFIQFQAMMKAS